MSSLRAVTLLALAAFASGAPATSTAPPQHRELVNLRAFARLYGVLRYFHPSDEAAKTDWFRFAVEGARRVREATDDRELAAALEQLVAPIGPTVRLSPAGDPVEKVPDPAGPELGGVEVVAWQHLGPGFSGGGIYRSKRTARTAEIHEGAGWSAIRKEVDATPLRGRRVRLRAWLRGSDSAPAAAWLRVDRAGGNQGFFDNMAGREVTAAEWTEAVLEGPVAEDAERIAFGLLVLGQGAGDIDDLELAVAGSAGTWTTVPIPADWLRGGRGSGDGFEIESIAGGRTGEATRLAARVTVLSEDLFPERPAIGEVADVDLGNGWRARVPIVLWSRDGRTLPTAPSSASPSPAKATERDERLADVIVAWSALDQFYPYFDVVPVDWAATLDSTLADALDDTGPNDHAETLERLVAALGDGHGRVVAGQLRRGLPVTFGQAEERVVVTASGVDSIRRGDLLLAVDGVEVAQALADLAARASGSPQWRAVRALEELGAGSEGFARLRLERDGRPIEVSVERVGSAPAHHLHPPLAEIENGVWYVDLARAEIAAIEGAMASLASARAVVFDLRGYPNGTHGVLEHLLDAPERDRWMHVAKRIRPRLPGAAPPVDTWESFGWDLEPRPPRIRGQVVFLTGPGAISYAESVMGYVEALGLPIVGAATAGANGNVQRLRLPSAASIQFTGMRVTRHDGSPFHGVGIRPTIAVQPTLAGIRAGRDEVLERALERIRSRH